MSPVDVTETDIPDVRILQPRVFGDARGYFMETWNRRTLSDRGLDLDFVQDNQSGSSRGVLRGLHYQIGRPQGKLVRVLCGEIFDVAVDLRRDSPTFGKWTGVTLSAEAPRQLWVPEGFAHGFLVLSDRAEIAYKCTDFYAPEEERTLLWNDETVGIQWPLEPGRAPLLSDKDAAGVPLDDAEVYP